MDRTHLRERDFREHFTVADSVAACRRAFELLGRGHIVNPPRVQTVEQRQGASHFHLDMPATWPGRYSVRKTIDEVSDVSSGRLGERQAWIDLDDLVSGALLRLDAGYITDMRTGAGGALGIELLASRPVRSVAILGTGRVARCLALACDYLFDLDQLRVTSRSTVNRDAFAAAVAPQLSTTLHMTSSIDACLAGADAMLTAVPTPTPIVDAAELDHIDTVAVIAGDSRTRQLHDDVLQSHRVVVDLLEQARQSGEFRHAATHDSETTIALARGQQGAVLTIADAACDRAPRTGGVAYLTGLAAQDLCAAATIYEALR